MQAGIDANRERSLLGVDVTDPTERNTVAIYADPVTHRLYCDMGGSGPSGSVTISGLGTDNSANSTGKLPVLAAVAATSAPSWTDGNMVPLSVDTATGGVRVTLTGTSGGAILTTETQPATSTITQILASTSAVTLSASNPSRRGLVLWNQSTDIAYIAIGGTASLSNYSYKLVEDGCLELPLPLCTSIVTAIWSGTNGYINITTFT